MENNEIVMDEVLGNVTEEVVLVDARPGMGLGTKVAIVGGVAAAGYALYRIIKRKMAKAKEEAEIDDAEVVDTEENED